MEELEKERERLRSFQAVQVKEEPQEELTQQHHHHHQQQEEEEEEIPAVPVKEEVKQEDKPVDPHQETDKETRFSPLKELQGTEREATPPQPPELRPSTSPSCQELPHTPAGLKGVATETTSASSPARSPTTSKLTEGSSPGPEHSVPPPLQLSVPPHVLQPHAQQLLPNDQLLRVLGERSGHWFSLLPRSPCDDTSLTQPKTPPPQSTSSPHHHHHQLLSLSSSISPLNPSPAGIQVTL